MFHFFKSYIDLFENLTSLKIKKIFEFFTTFLMFNHVKKNFYLCKFSKNKAENDFNLLQTTFSGFSTFNTFSTDEILGSPTKVQNPFKSK